MWPVIYRILYPFIIGGLLLFFGAHSQYKSYKKLGQKDKTEKKRKRIIASFLFCISIVIFSYSTFLSFDLILHDFTTCQGRYIKSFRGKDIITTELFFESDSKTITSDAFTSELKDYNLEEGKIYEIVYSKRTQMIIKIKEKM
jgi:hypothetical protein